jgi:uncharacterized protein YciI
MNAEILKNHVSYLKELDSKGQLLLTGPFLDRKGGMVIIKAASLDEAEKIAESDPFITSGVQSYQLKAMKQSCKENNYLAPE